MAQSLPSQPANDKSGKPSLRRDNSKFAPNAAPMNPDKVSEMNMDTEGAPPKITFDQIKARAHEIWTETGREEGCDIRNWLQAEEELRNRTTDKNFK